MAAYNFPILLVLLSRVTANDYYLKNVNNNNTHVSRIISGADEVCYDDLGCFSTNEPWNSVGRVAFLPNPPRVISTQFLLYTRRNKNDPQKIIAGDVSSLLNSYFNGQKPTKFIVHGFIDWGTSPWVKKMAMQFLTKEDANVFCIDWHLGAQTLYSQAVANTRVVGAEIAKMIKFLSIYTSLRHSNVHVIGHSLGAHIAGYVGSKLEGLGRITGMDPAGLYFENMDPLVRLDASDAEFVEVLHTDGGSLLRSLVFEGGFGTWQPSGHVDVYVSGGIKQPGCSEVASVQAVLSDGLIDGARSIFICSHCRAFEYMTETIVAAGSSASCPWRSYSCPSWEEFQTGRCLHCLSGSSNKICNSVGYLAKKPADGSENNPYWMATGPQPPFCRFHYHVQLTLLTKANKEQKGKLWFKLTGSRGSIDDFYLVNEKGHNVLKSGSTYDFLVLTPKNLGRTIKSVEIKWENVASWLDITQWQIGQPTIYLKKVTVFSGEHQTEFSFCDISGDPLKSLHSLILSNRC